MPTDTPQEPTSTPAGTAEAVSVVGLGLMGRALAGALLRAGHPTTVWNRTSGRAEQLVAQGATLADSVTAAATASPLVIVCVSDYDAVRELVDSVGDALDGRVLVNLTSGTSRTARDTAALVAGRGGAYLDGAIMAIPPAIGTADAALLYSGPRSNFDRHEPTLTSLGAGTTWLGEDHRLSSLYDMALLSLMWSVWNGWLHGAALVGTAGVDAATFAHHVRQGLGTMANWLADDARRIDDRAHLEPAADSAIDTHRAAMEHLVEECRDLGIDTDLPRFTKALAERAIAAGHGGADYAAMIEQFREPSHPRP